MLELIVMAEDKLAVKIKVALDGKDLDLEKVEPWR